MIVRVRFSIFKRLVFLFIGKIEIDIPMKHEPDTTCVMTETPKGIDIELEGSYPDRLSH